MSARPMENAIWALCLDTRRGYVKAESSDFDRIVIRMPDLIDDEDVVLRLSRKDARLLARRLNQCLDATRRP